MDSAEEEEISVRKQSAVRKKRGNAPSIQKATKVTGVNDETSDVEKGSDTSEGLGSDASNPGTDKNSRDEPSSSVDELESQPGSEVASIPEKKNPSVRKPSKRVIETALNEVSFVTTH